MFAAMTSVAKGDGEADQRSVEELYSDLTGSDQRISAAIIRLSGRGLPMPAGQPSIGILRCVMTQVAIKSMAQRFVVSVQPGIRDALHFSDLLSVSRPGDVCLAGGRAPSSVSLCHDHRRLVRLLRVVGLAMLVRASRCRPDEFPDSNGHGALVPQVALTGFGSGNRPGTPSRL